MESSIFKFKQFAVDSSRSAMKIGTDGVLLGAWAPVDGCRTAWDIGCGTGLIALMLAQRGVERVVGIDIDTAAAEEAAANVAASPWPDRISIVNDNICACYQSLPQPDLIVSNPPFFTDSLLSNNEQRDLARHQNSLTYKALMRIAADSLSADGRLCMIAPMDASEEIEFIALINKLCVTKTTIVSTVEGKLPKRRLWEFSRVGRPTEKSFLYLRDEEGNYTEQYRELTKDFYLDL